MVVTNGHDAFRLFHEGLYRSRLTSCESCRFRHLLQYLVCKQKTQDVICTQLMAEAEPMNSIGS